VRACISGNYGFGVLPRRAGTIVVLLVGSGVYIGFRIVERWPLAFTIIFPASLLSSDGRFNSGVYA
jgi:hypothetical protein